MHTHLRQATHAEDTTGHDDAEACERILTEQELHDPNDRLDPFCDPREEEAVEQEEIEEENAKLLLWQQQGRDDDAEACERILTEQELHEPYDCYGAYDPMECMMDRDPNCDDEDQCEI
jgi:hypothetical protein